jgi:hypothetical protein
MTVNLLSSVAYDTASVCLNNQLSYLFSSLRRAFPPGSELVSSELARSLEFVSFSVMDLLRAKCFGSVEEMRRVLKNLQENPEIQLVRVKNRLETGNRDFLINFSFKDCRLLC